jgi:hypothetical protein
MGLRDRIIDLRVNERKTYNQIREITGASKGTISYHLSSFPLSKEEVASIRGESLPPNINIEELVAKINEGLTIDSLVNYFQSTEHHIKSLMSKQGLTTKNSLNRYSATGFCRFCSKASTRNICGSCRTKLRRVRAKKAAIEYLGGKCCKCGWTGALPAYEFNHLNPTVKAFTIGNILHKSWDFIKQELDKCELLCSNCHRIHHSDRTEEFIEYAINKYNGGFESIMGVKLT